jgi:hypothetical protein
MAFHLVYTAVASRSLLTGPDSYSILSLRSNDSQSSVPFDNSSSSANTGTFQGWTASPNGRGTIDIIWSCVLTIYLCSWTVLCLNVPPADCTSTGYSVQKFLITCEGILGPEFVFQTALGQWMSARRSVRQFKELTSASTTRSDSSTDPKEPQWTLKNPLQLFRAIRWHFTTFSENSKQLRWEMAHAFFADMGGFVLDPPDFVRFPLDAKQVHYLVHRNYVDLDTVMISKRILNDKNKGDGMTRLITVLQIIWFVINTITRHSQHLAVTMLELATLGYIVCTLGTYYFWAHKPLDIREPIILVPKATMADILLNAGEGASQPYMYTPMDFVGYDNASWFLYWTYWFNILVHMGISFHTRKRPVDKISDDRFPALDRKTLPVLFLFQTGYAAVHIAGWNYPFPTHTEHLLWRIATIYIISAILVYWIADIHAWHVFPRLKKRWIAKQQNHPPADNATATTSTEKHKSTKTITTLQDFAERIRNNSPNKDPNLSVPLKALLPVTSVAAVYCIARGFVVIEAFISLRALPPSAYDSVNWSFSWLPHF